MKEKVKNKLETNVAELLMVAMVVMVLLSSCGTTKGYGCGQASFIKNAHLCPAYH